MLAIKFLHNICKLNFLTYNWFYADGSQIRYYALQVCCVFLYKPVNLFCGGLRFEPRTNKVLSYRSVVSFTISQLFYYVVGYDLNLRQIRHYACTSVVFFTISRLIYSVKDLGCVKVKRIET